MVKRRLFAMGGMRGRPKPMGTRTITLSPPAEPIITGPGQALLDMYKQLPAGTKEYLQSTASKAGQKLTEVVMNKAGDVVKKITKQKLPTERGSKIPLNRVLMINPSTSKSYTYWGKLTKSDPQRDADRRYGFFKVLNKGTLTWGDNASDYGIQKQMIILENATGTEAYNQATEIRNVAWKSHKIRVISQTLKVNFYNMDLVPATITIYECVARLSQMQDPLVCWGNLINAMEMGTGSSSLSQSDIDAVPEWVPGWRKIWKVFRKTTFTLQPGSFHDHIARYSGFNEMSINNIYSSPPIAAGATNLHTYVRGLTTSMFINVKGSTVRTNETTPKITTSTPIISWTSSKWTRMSVLETHTPVYHETGSYDTIDPTLLLYREKDGDSILGAQTETKEN